MASSNICLSSALLFIFLLPFCTGQASPKFRCSEEKKCQAMAAFVPAADTTYAAIKELFQVGSIYDIYGANGLNESTPASAKVPGNATVRVPFPCVCANGAGLSDGKPLYTTKTGDSLKKIAAETFGGLVTDLQIAAANRIANASSIVNVGQLLFIPLPCSCDILDISPAVHLAHVVREETNLAEISEKYSVFISWLLSFNNIPDSRILVRGQVLDVPLPACFSETIRYKSPDYMLYVPNGSYALTAYNCIKCSCHRPWSELYCRSSPSSVQNKSWGCLREDCSMNKGEELGTYYLSSCVTTRCLYAGYGEHLIWTTRNILNYSRCPSSGPDETSQKKSETARVERGYHVGLTLLLFMLLLA